MNDENDANEFMEDVSIASHQFANVSLDIDFLLWTRKNPISFYRMKYNKDLPKVLNQSQFSPNLQTKILIHGYEDTGTTDWIIGVKDTYLKKGKSEFLPKFKNAHIK